MACMSKRTGSSVVVFGMRAREFRKARAVLLRTWGATILMVLDDVVEASSFRLFGG